MYETFIYTLTFTYNNGVPGVVHSSLVHGIVLLFDPVQFPPATSSTDLVRVCVWVPSAQVTEQSEADSHAFHSQLTTIFE